MLLFITFTVYNKSHIWGIKFQVILGNLVIICVTKLLSNLSTYKELLQRINSILHHSQATKYCGNKIAISISYYDQIWW